MYTSTAQVKYEELLVTTYTFPKEPKPALGEWKIEFLYGNERIGEHRLTILDPARYQAKLTLENQASL